MYQIPLRYLHALFPADPQVSACEEARDSMPCQMMDPSLLPQLSHDGINPWETSAGLSPLCQGFRVLLPWDLHADGIALHFVKMWVVSSSSVEELTPQQLTVKGQRWDTVLLNLRSE